MENQSNEPDVFFDHFGRADKPTKMGMRLVRALSRRFFRYAEIASGNSILEIGPGRGVLSDVRRPETTGVNNRDIRETVLVIMDAAPSISPGT